MTHAIKHSSARCRETESASMAPAIGAQSGLSLVKPRPIRASRSFADPMPPSTDRSAQIAWAHRAIRSGRARLALQPVSAAATRETAFHEALLRILDTDGTPIAAGDFIDSVEGAPLIVEIDCAVVRMATAMLRKDPELALSINASPHSFTTEFWCNTLDLCLAAEPEIAKRLIIELTETMPIVDLDAVRAVMNHFRHKGVRFALDDFGAGFTMLTHLRDLRFDFVKLDGKFTRSVESDATQQTFVRALIDIARHFNLTLVAEHVESDAEALALTNMGVTMMQGHLLGRPHLAGN